MAHGTPSNGKRTHRRLLLIVLASFMTGAIGCSSSSDQPELGLVTGTITFDGSPLSGVAVSFVPADGRPAMGKTDADGRYQLTYIRDTLGCKVGANRVEIGNTEETDEESGDESGEDEAQEGDDLVQKPVAKKSARSAAAKIPARYNTNSELTADVKPGENTFDFSLTSQK